MELSDGKMFRKKRRFYRVPWSRRIVYLLLSIAITARFGYLFVRPEHSALPVLRAGTFITTDVADPCHVTINDSAGHEFNIRIIGIRPATREPAWLESASRAAKDFCLGRHVMVRLDKRRVDVDGVHLAHVYVGDELLSYYLVKNGMAVVYSTPSDSPSIIRQLTKAESIAKQDRIGFWSNTPKPNLAFSRSQQSVESRLAVPHDATRSMNTTRTRSDGDTRAN